MLLKFIPNVINKYYKQFQKSSASDDKTSQVDLFLSSHRSFALNKASSAQYQTA